MSALHTTSRSKLSDDSSDSDLSDSDADLHSVDSSASLPTRRRRSSVRVEPRRPSFSRIASSQHVRTPIDAPAAALDRLTAADHFQSLCLSAYILQCENADVGLWLAARVVPLSWCDAAIAFLKPLDDDVRASLDATYCLLSSLQPPFHRARLATFERQLAQLETVLQRASNALQDVRDQASGIERELALRRLQLWTRDVLSKRHFYSVKVQLRQRHHRGLIPGLFDGLHEESVLTVDAVHATVTVEYPRALDRPGSPRHKIV